MTQRKMKRLAILAAAALALLLVCSVRVTGPMLRMMMAHADRISTEPAYADSCEKRIGLPYVDGGSPEQVLDIYYADGISRKDAVLIDIHGGFYIAGKRQNNRPFASVFLKEGFDVVLVEYRLNDGKRDVQDELSDCAKALDYLAGNAASLGINRDAMFLTGDSAGGHLALYLAEGAQDASLPVRPGLFVPKGLLLNCPAYDCASFADMEIFTKGARKLFIGPRYKDEGWRKSVSPRTYLGSYTGPLFVSISKKDFIRSQSLLLKEDCEAAGRPLEFTDIQSDGKKAGHVHNVISPGIPESREVNSRMVEFMDRLL